MPRCRIKQSATLEDRLIQKAQRLRQEADETLARVDRARLLRQARQVETAAEICDWLRPSQARTSK